MKVITMYLPQFHRVEENDEWWGEGFTEWTTVKNAQSLYDGHVQPVVPYNNNYYDLIEHKTMQWQTNLMKKYGVDGICMYHYWFKDGRRILEKPAENLLQWKDIQMPFCFCWANETWARTWSGIQDINVWASTFEKKQYGEKSILLEQKYGTEKEWIIHFEYLLDFFRDDRYIKIDNKPVFMIYRPDLMPCIERMIELWKTLVRKAGFSGIYLIGGDCGECQGIHDNAFDKVLVWEPGQSIRNAKVQGFVEKKNGILLMNYDQIWKNILHRKVITEKTIFGGFVNYDDTPRRGRKGIVIEGGSPNKFERYLAELFGKNKAVDNELIFINAWNEWGEGMYLEPDEANAYRYLEAIQTAKETYSTHIDKYLRLHEEQQNMYRNPAEGRYKHYYTILDKWLCMKEQDIKLQDYLCAQGYHTVALYGYGVLAKHLEQELENSSINIKYVIDRSKENVCANFPVYHPDDVLPVVDVIIITATFSCGAVFSCLYEKGIYNVISLEEIIMEII